MTSTARTLRGAGLATGLSLLASVGLKAQELPPSSTLAPDAAFPEDSGLFVLSPVPGRLEQGVMAGPYRVIPSIEFGGLVNSNVDARPRSGSSDVALTVSPAIEVVRSDDVLDLGVFLRLDYAAYANTARNNLFNASAGIDVRRAINARNALRLVAQGGRFTEDRTVAFAPLDARSPIKFDQFLGRIELTHAANAIILQPSVTVSRLAFHDNALLSVPTQILPQRNRNIIRIDGELTGSYALSATTQLFAGGQYNRRDYDVTTVPERDSYGYRLFGGFRFRPSPLTRLTLAAGYQRQFYGRTLTNPKGAYLSGVFEWSPSRSSIVSASVRRDISETGALELGGAIRTRVRIKLDHEVRRDVRLSLSGGYDVSRVNLTGARDIRKSAQFLLRYYATPRLELFGTLRATTSKSATAFIADNTFDQAILSGGARFNF